MNKVKQFSKKEVATIADALMTSKNTYEAFGDSFAKYDSKSKAWFNKQRKSVEEALQIFVSKMANTYSANTTRLAGCFHI